jgi:hypothetical protein
VTLTQTVLGLVAGTVLAAWSIPLIASALACHDNAGSRGPSIIEEQSGSQDIL